MLQRFLHYKRKMRALGTIAIHILTIVLILPDGIGKHFFRLIDLHPYFGQEGHFKWRSVLLYKSGDVYSVKF